MQENLKMIKNPLKTLLNVGADFHIEIDKSDSGLRILTAGVKRIKELSEKSISLKAKGFTLKISGERLSLSLYEDKTVEIRGKLEVIEFENTKN